MATETESNPLVDLTNNQSMGNQFFHIFYTLCLYFMLEFEFFLVSKSNPICDMCESNHTIITAPRTIITHAFAFLYIRLDRSERGHGTDGVNGNLSYANGVPMKPVGADATTRAVNNGFGVMPGDRTLGSA